MVQATVNIVSLVLKDTEYISAWYVCISPISKNIVTAAQNGKQGHVRHVCFAFFVGWFHLSCWGLDGSSTLAATGRELLEFLG